MFILKNILQDLNL